jgi:hypothetical protein
MINFMNMRAIFSQLTATDPARLNIETAKRHDIFETAKRKHIQTKPKN